MKTEFERVVQIGQKRVGPLWDGLTDGFHSLRKVFAENKEYIISCKITSDDGNRPKFVCEVTDDRNLLQTVSSLASTTAMKAALALINVSDTGNMSGLKFFGLKLKFVSQRVREAPLKSDKRSDDGADSGSEEGGGVHGSEDGRGGDNGDGGENDGIGGGGDEGNFDLAQLPVVQNRRGTVKWLGLKSEGVPHLDDDRYLLKFKSGSTIRLQPGYEGVRVVSVGSQLYTLHCCIERSDDGPLYVVKIVEPNSAYQSLKITEAVRLALDSISYQKTRKMGSLEFYGFQLTEVHNVLRIHEAPGQSNSLGKYKFMKFVLFRGHTYKVSL